MGLKGLFTRARLAIVAAAMMLVSVAGVAPAHAEISTSDWAMGGQNIANTRYQPDETQLSTENVATLHTKWIANMAGDVTATPAVVDGAVYVPDWGGYISKLNAETGALVWSQRLDTLLGNTDTAHRILSRTSPAVSGKNVLIGTQRGGYLLNLDATTGALVWKASVDPHSHPLAIVTNSPVIFKGVAYVGVASTEEAAVAFGWPCCSFRGSISAFKVSSGERLWSTDTIDDAAYNAGFKGASIWGSTATVDHERGSLYITTGNDYTAPQSVKDCEARLQPGDVDRCEDNYPGNHVDSIMSLALNTGAVKWARRFNGYDAWNVACIFGNPSACPNPAGPDFDFGQGAMLIKNNKTGDVLAAGQKSGFLWGLDPQTGSIKWSYFAGPGSSLGGLQWGSATDGKQIYYALVNLFGISYPLTNPAPGSPRSTRAGLWGAVDVATGRPLWQHADPNGAVDMGPVSVANGVVYASSFGGRVSVPGSSVGKPTMFALDAQTGAIKWQYVTGASVNAGPAISDGSLYWGGGYANLGLGDPDHHLYSFSN